jgi:hypothetical protein
MEVKIVILKLIIVMLLGLEGLFLGLFLVILIETLLKVIIILSPAKLIFFILVTPTVFILNVICSNFISLIIILSRFLGCSYRFLLMLTAAGRNLISI